MYVYTKIKIMCNFLPYGHLFYTKPPNCADPVQLGSLVE